MFTEKKYVGIALESDTFKIAEVKPTKDGIQLISVDKYTLVDALGSGTQGSAGDSLDMYGQTEEKSEEIFGFDEESQEEREKADVDFAELEANAEEEAFEIGEIDEEDKPATNYVLLYNILNDISRKRIDVGFNIPIGNAIYQILNDTNYKKLEEKQIVEIIEDKLQAIYGDQKSSDFYAYEVREDGSMILASIDDSPRMLHLIDEAQEFYRGTLKIKNIYPDEAALIGLFQENYNPDSNEITALIQFEKKTCRIIFFQGNNVYLIPAAINQGTSSHDFLNVVFSKILFQLDSGEVPALHRIVVANNSIGNKALDFFEENFSGIEVEDFQFKKSFLDRGNFDDNAVKPFTTAIAMGAAAVQRDEGFPHLSMIPDYVIERQKIFKLEWHGIALLVLIFLTFPVANYFYQQNANEIESLSTDLERTNQRIEIIQPTVEQTNEISQNLSLLTSKLSLLDSLSAGSRAWSTKLNILDEEMNRIPNSWFTSMSQSQDGAFLEGYSLYRSRIPAIVDIFDKATLLNVNTEITREQEIYKFSMMVQQFVADTTLYSPEKPESIEQILNN